VRTRWTVERAETRAQVLMSPWVLVKASPTSTPVEVWWPNLPLGQMLIENLRLAEVVMGSVPAEPLSQMVLVSLLAPLRVPARARALVVLPGVR
jgi:hypothetical protein